MQRTWKPAISGVLNISLGVISIIGGVNLSIGSYDFLGSPLQVPQIGIPLIICGVVSIIGGITAIMRKLWKLALAGVILAVPSGLVFFFYSRNSISNTNREF